MSDCAHVLTPWSGAECTLCGLTVADDSNTTEGPDVVAPGPSCPTGSETADGRNDEYSANAREARAMTVRVARGWFRLWRQVFTSRSLQARHGEEARAMEAWTWVLALVNYEDNETHAPPLRAGQCLLSLGAICDYTNWSRSRARRWLDALERDGMIERRAIGRSTVITVVNWHDYQGHNEGTTWAQRGLKLGTANQAETGEKLADMAQAGHKQGTTLATGGHATTEEGKKRTIEEEIDADALPRISPPPDLSTKKGREAHYQKPGRNRSAPTSYPDAFEAFWSAVRWAGGKASAYVEWRALVVDGVDPDAILAAAQRYGQSDDVRGGFVRNCPKWLREGDLERWMLQAKPAQPKPSGAATDVVAWWVSLRINDRNRIAGECIQRSNGEAWDDYTAREWYRRQPADVRAELAKVVE